MSRFQTNTNIFLPRRSAPTHVTVTQNSRATFNATLLSFLVHASTKVRWDNGQRKWEGEKARSSHTLTQNHTTTNILCAKKKKQKKKKNHTHTHKNPVLMDSRKSCSFRVVVLHVAAQLNLDAARSSERGTRHSRNYSHLIDVQLNNSCGISAHGKSSPQEDNTAKESFTTTSSEQAHSELLQLDATLTVDTSFSTEMAVCKKVFTTASKHTTHFSSCPRFLHWTSKINFCNYWVISNPMPSSWLEFIQEDCQCMRRAGPDLGWLFSLMWPVLYLPVKQNELKTRSLPVLLNKNLHGENLHLLGHVFGGFPPGEASYRSRVRDVHKREVHLFFLRAYAVHPQQWELHWKQKRSQTRSLGARRNETRRHNWAVSKRKLLWKKVQGKTWQTSKSRRHGERAHQNEAIFENVN